MAEAEENPVVIDNGSNTCRAGFAGASRPSCVFPSVVGRPRSGSTKVGMDLKERYVGDEAQSKRDVLSIRYPVEYGIVTNWDDMEKLWHHIFYNELRVDTEEHPVLLTEAPMNPKANREKMTQIMFETFNSPAMYVAIQAVLSLYASGRTTGMVVDSGYQQSHVFPVIFGCSIPACTFKSFVSGQDLTYFLLKLLNENGSDFKTSEETKIVRDIKETLCYLAYDYKHEIDTVTASTVNRSYLKPDGQFLTVGQERFKCPEAIFQPILAGLEYPGVDDIIVSAVNRCNESEQSELYANIHLSGGNTLFPGFPERLRKEVESRAPAGSNVQVYSSPMGILSPWVGGSMMAAEPSFDSKCITSELYDEYGPSIVHKMCF